MRTHQAPAILSMDVDDEVDSEYRVLINGQVKYITIAPGTYDRETLSTPLDSLPTLPKDDEWNIAYISRDPTTKELKTSLSNRKLAGVNETWHSSHINCLDLTRVNLLSANVFEATCPSEHLAAPATTVIAKIARFEWELPRIEQETCAYKMLEGSDLAPRVLGHIHEHGRVMGILLEKIEGGSEASIDDLEICRRALERLHGSGLVHGDSNRYNFIVRKGTGTVKLIDFENSRKVASGDGSAREAEIDELEDQLKEETGRGGGFIVEER